MCTANVIAIYPLFYHLFVAMGVVRYNGRGTMAENVAPVDNCGSVIISI